MIRSTTIVIVLLSVVLGLARSKLASNHDVEGEEAKVVMDSRKVQSRVIGGSAVSAGEWPFFAKLVHEEDFSCMSGNTGLLKLSEKGTIDDKYEVTKLTDIMPFKDQIKGYDENMKSKSCRVKAVGQFGRGILHGNYTADHYIFDPKSESILEHGEGDAWLATRENKYEIFTTCPINEDESGKLFTPIDSDFCGGDLKQMSWSDYVLLHKAILRIVNQAGGFYFDISSYKRFDLVQKFAPRVCSSMLECMQKNDPAACGPFEENALTFMTKTLQKKAKKKTKKSFPNIGKHMEPGSVTSYILVRTR